METSPPRPCPLPSVLVASNGGGAAPNVRTVADVQKWLADLGFSQYAHVFLTNEVDGVILKTLTSEELRDDLLINNLRHRREILVAIARLVEEEASPDAQKLPEHGRILDHLSNVRTYHSWISVGIQFLGFAVVTLRLSPNFRDTNLITASSIYFSLIGISALVYGVYRYKNVIGMIESSGPSTKHFSPDRVGVVSILLLAFAAVVLTLTILALRD
ncbi:unnamed protein product [Agarophyton chilense]